MARLGSVAVAVAAVALGAACAGSRGSAQGAGQAQAQAQAQAPRAGRGAAMMRQCPMAVPGTQVRATDTDDGEAITFTTSSQEQVPELRSRVRAMAEMHNRHAEARQAAGDRTGGGGAAGGGGAEEGSAGSAQGSGEAGGADQQGAGGMGGMGEAGGMGGTGGMGGMGGMHAAGGHGMPASRAMVMDVDGGARVIVTADDPADADRLRATIRMHADRMSETGACAMDPDAAPGR